MVGDFITTVYGSMSAELASSPLNDLCVPDGGVQTGPFGSQLHAGDYVDYGTPIITVEHLGDNRIIHTNLPRVSDEDKERLARYTLITGDIVFSRVGSVDRRAIVHPEEDSWLFSGRCLRVRPDRKKIDPGFLSWFFGLPGFQEHIRQIAVGATMPSLNTKILGDVPIYYPPSLKEQQAIACILGALDDKIELSRRMNQTLEAMARAIFKSWFVDFGPVRAKAAVRREHPDWTDKQVSNAAYLGLKPEIASLFPDSFEDSELGEIPKGWLAGTVREQCELAYGKALKAEDRHPGNIPVMGSNGQVGFHNEAFVKGPGVIVGRKGNPGIVTWVNSDFFPIDTTFYVASRSSCPLTFLFYTLENLNLPSLGSDSAVPGLNRNIAYMSQLLVPDELVLKVFDKQASTIRDHQNVLENESRTLATLRDTLLPKLISGELRVKDAKRFLEKRKN